MHIFFDMHFFNIYFIYALFLLYHQVSQCYYLLPYGQAFHKYKVCCVMLNFSRKWKIKMEIRMLEWVHTKL